ncbi:hypothetical protein ACGFYA_20705 [Streptomyces sp. NPDC048305]|uniref:hypothetical protein n=1 Tax=Streptomyces sp. NPDC048305 TaxID=3365532 RepID=UPI00371AF803
MSDDNLVIRYHPSYGSLGVYDRKRRKWRGHSQTEAGCKLLRRNIRKWDSVAV